jgi:hypothetical protein|tara:strand:+ start:156 stop:437 length:282 start_codon:yes stop_codon:yes gene_type:complete
MWLSQEAIDANIKVVYHPGYVEGMTFVSGTTTTAGSLYSVYEIGNAVGNEAYKKGYSNIVILVEVLSPGQLNPVLGTNTFISEQGTYRIGIYK